MQPKIMKSKTIIFLKMKDDMNFLKKEDDLNFLKMEDELKK